jgi:hypothetical protein
LKWGGSSPFWNGAIKASTEGSGGVERGKIGGRLTWGGNKGQFFYF